MESVESMLVLGAVLGILILLSAASAEGGRPGSAKSSTVSNYQRTAYVDRIPEGLKSRFSNLKDPAIRRYTGYIIGKSMASHGDEFCKEAGIICESNVDLEVFGGHNRYEWLHNRTTIFSPIAKPIGCFREKELYKGAKIALPDLRNPTLKRSFLPSALSSQFPFSSDGLLGILGMLNMKDASIMATRMASALHECESKIQDGDDIKFCATSAEELFKLARGAMGYNNKFGILETSSSEGSHQTVELMDVRLRASTNQMVIECHDMPFPYTVFYCHKISKTRVYETSWRASNGKMVHAVAVCHLNPRHFDAFHPTFAFANLHFKHDEAAICHWMSESNPVWFSK